MKPEAVATNRLYPKGNPLFRLFALWYFAILMIVWNVLGHSILGFEQSWLQWFVALGTAIAMQVGLESIDAWANGRTPRHAGGVANFVNTLPPAIIAGSACSMLLFANTHVWPMAFAAAIAISSKGMFRAPVGGGATMHYFNPSNFAVVVTLLTHQWVGLGPPYQFTNHVEGIGNLIVPGVVMGSGLLLHGLFTGRLPLLVAWIVGFIAQGLVRSALFGMPWHVPLWPMTSAAFVLFTNYMIPDPATSPIDPKAQVAFGLGVAAVYGTLQSLHIVWGFFLALVIVCGVRGLYLHLYARLAGD